MILIREDIKQFYTVRLENLQTEVSGYHLSHELAAEIGFETITGRTDVIEKTRLIEKAEEWHVYGIQWETTIQTGEFPSVRREDRFTRVYVRKINVPQATATRATGPGRALSATISGAPAINH